MQGVRTGCELDGCELVADTTVDVGDVAVEVVVASREAVCGTVVDAPRYL
jgi:hypothetical protein